MLLCHQDPVGADLGAPPLTEPGETSSIRTRPDALTSTDPVLPAQRSDPNQVQVPTLELQRAGTSASADERTPGTPPFILEAAGAPGERLLATRQVG